MNSPHADDVFGIQFDDAVGAMHQRSVRGDKPSADLWHDVRSQMKVNEMEVPAVTAVSPMQATSTRLLTAGNNETRQVPAAWPAADQSGRLRSPSTWVALGLVLMLVISGLYLNLNQQPGNSDQQLAWAPGTTTADPSDQIVASPWASPAAIEYGPEFACNVEPLTVDEVYEMVLNPNRGLQRHGASLPDSQLAAMQVEGGDSLYWRGWFSQSQPFGSTNDPDILTPITETANTFWNCLMTGTAYQVWALMYPSTVQHEILTHYPVLRDEHAIRAHIEKWGPMRYSASIYHAFPDLGGTDPIRASMHVDESVGSTAITYQSTSDVPVSAIVMMIPHPESGSSPLNYRELLLRRSADGTWLVIAINYPDNLRGRG